MSDPIADVDPNYGYMVGIRNHDGSPFLHCLACSKTTYNLHDVTQHYCPCCHVFLDDKLREAIILARHTNGPAPHE